MILFDDEILSGILIESRTEGRVISDPSMYHYLVIQQVADGKFYMQDGGWGHIFDARRFEGTAEEQETSINAAFGQMEQRNKSSFKKEQYRVLKGTAVFTFSVLT